MPPAADSLRGQIPLLPSRTLREAVAKGFDVLTSAALQAAPPQDMAREIQHWDVVARLALEELGHREPKALAELAAHPPAHLVAAIGRPDPGDASIARSARGSWLAVSEHVVAYRLQYSIGDRILTIRGAAHL